MSEVTVKVRAGVPADVPLIAALVRDLADYERLPAQCHADADAMARHLFGPDPAAEVLIAEVDDVPVGFALFFPTFSTFRAQRGLWLEDLFVAPTHRGQGVGRALLRAVAQRAVDRGCGRLEWSVLDWNTSAIAFYTGLGADLLQDWTICRSADDALIALASS